MGDKNYKKFENELEIIYKNWNCNEDYHEDESGEFYEESYIKKILSNSLDIFTNWSLNLGNHHFGITINMPDTLSQSWDGISRYDYDTMDLEGCANREDDIKEIIIDHFPTTTYIFIIIEKNKKGRIHMHLLVSIRNFMDYNYTLKNNLSLVLKNNLSTTSLTQSDFDIKVDSLLYFKDIKNWGMYIFKDMFIWKFPARLYLLNKYKENPSCLNLNANLTTYYIQLKFEYILFEISDDKSNNISGIRIMHNKLNREVLLDILQYYLVLNNYFIYNNDIYQKVEGYSISYKLVGDVKTTLYDYFQKNIIKFFTLNYFYYFDGFDFQYLLKKYFLKHKNDIIKLGEISTQKIEPDFSLMEFTDGVYSIKYDRFFPKSDGVIFSENISTIKYYNKSYARVRRKRPNTWIKGLQNALGIQSDIEYNKDFVNICLYLVNIVHKDIFTKKSTLFIHGKSNTGKTTYLIKPIKHFLGNENVGMIVSGKNFKYQNLEDKIVGIIDEGRYNSSMSSDLLKIMGKEDILIDKKYSDHINIKPIPLFILSNEEFKDKNPSIDEALKNRMCIIEFINEVLGGDMNFSELLKNEEPNIIIFANKLFFKIKMGNKMGSKVPNDDIIKKIEHK